MRGTAHQRAPDAAKGTRAYVDKDPHPSERAAPRAPGPAHGPRVSVDELVAKGRSIFDPLVARFRPLVARATARLRTRFRRAQP